MISWIQIVKTLVALGVLAGVVLWIHRASVRQVERSASERKPSS